MRKKQAQETVTRTRKPIADLTLMDDVFMTAVLDDNVPATELILRTVLGIPDLEVIEQQVQRDMRSLHGRAAILDVWARDSSGTVYDIEVQNASGGASPRRARRNAAFIDVEALESGRDLGDMPESYVIFITRDDVLGGGLPIYHVSRHIEETGDDYGDGSHIVYVNCAYDGPGEVDDPLRLLVKDMMCAQPDKMHYSELASRARDLKGDEAVMRRRDDMIDDVFQEALRTGLEQGVALGRAEGREQGLAEGRAEGRVEGHAEGRAEGRAEGHAEGCEQTFVHTVSALVESGGCSVQEAADLLKVPEDMREAILKALS